MNTIIKLLPFSCHFWILISSFLIFNVGAKPRKRKPKPPKTIFAQQCEEGSTLKVYRVKTAFSNAFIISQNEEAIVVDSGDPGSWRQIRRRIKKADLLGKVKMIFITHSHFDHAGGAKGLSDKLKVPVVIHRQDAEDLREGITNVGVIKKIPWTGDAVAPWIKGAIKYQGIEAHIQLSQNITQLNELEDIQFNELEGFIRRLPGHTGGSSVLQLFCDDKTLVFTGDLMAARGKKKGTIQKTFAQDWLALEFSYEAFLEMEPSLAFPGHGHAPIAGTHLK